MSKAKPIIKIVDDISLLHERMDEVVATTSFETVKSTVHDLKDTIKSNKDLIALAAPQIGIKLRLFCMRMADGLIKVFLNPMIVKKEGLHMSRETNPCIKGKEYIIPRYDEISVTFQEFDGRISTNIFKGAASEIAQQMIEVLEGILISDYGLEVIEGFDQATEEEKAQIIKMYLDSLKQASVDLKKEVEENPELKLVNDTIEFEKGLLDGSIKPLKKESGEEPITKEGAESGTEPRIQ